MESEFILISPMLLLFVALRLCLLLFLLIDRLAFVFSSLVITVLKSRAAKSRLLSTASDQKVDILGSVRTVDVLIMCPGKLLLKKEQTGRTKTRPQTPCIYIPFIS
jgi:hypothetical protein